MAELRYPRPFGWGRGHAAGEFLESERWQILEEREGYLLLEAHLPPHVLNPAGQLFGGFTGAYIDYVALRTCWAGREDRRGGWLSTVTMQIHYLEPVLPPRVRLRSALVTQRRRTYLVETRIEDLDGRVLVHATTSLLEGTRGRPGGDGAGDLRSGDGGGAS
ncbi:MAG TPA: PaaI family thioesterase [Dehalococcoidia bacterium]